MKRNIWNYETGIYLIIFLIAIGMRCSQLDFRPLGEIESSWALQSLNLIKGASPVVIGPGYALLTSALFYLLGSSNAIARLIPAVMGAGLVWVPFLFRRPVGTKAALILALGLAIDPGLVSVSRLAGSDMWALVTVLLAVGCAFIGNSVFTGIFIGLALLSGPGIWGGGLALLIAVAASLRPVIRGEVTLNQYSNLDWKIVGGWALGIFLLVGTGFGLKPVSLSAAFNGIAQYFSGWTYSSDVLLISPLLALFYYQFPVLLIGLASIFTNFNRQSRLDWFLASWWLASLVLTIIYPARQINDMIWSMVPLWALAARNMVSWFDISRRARIIALATTALSILLLVFSWLNVLGLLNVDAAIDPQKATIYKVLAAAGIIVLLLTVVLIAMGWSTEGAVKGFLWGMLAIMVTFLLMNARSASGLGRYPQYQLWGEGQPVVDADLLDQTLSQISSSKTGEPHRLDIKVAGINSSALRWLLRDYEQVTYEVDAPALSVPSMLITNYQETVSMVSQYRGQDFVWREVPAMENLYPLELLNWFVYRDVEEMREQQVFSLWVRTDLFPGENIEITTP